MFPLRQRWEDEGPWTFLLPGFVSFCLPKKADALTHAILQPGAWKSVPDGTFLQQQRMRTSRAKSWVKYVLWCSFVTGACPWVPRLSTRNNTRATGRSWGKVLWVQSEGQHSKETQSVVATTAGVIMNSRRMNRHPWKLRNIILKSHVVEKVHSLVYYKETKCLNPWSRR